MKDIRICKIDNCENKHFGLGYCNKHYIRFKRHGDALYSNQKEMEYHNMTGTPIYIAWINLF